MDLAAAEDQLPEYINPVSLHRILTSEYTVSSPEDRSFNSDNDSFVFSKSGFEIGQEKKNLMCPNCSAASPRGPSKFSI